jgi:hypothetical protein
MVSHGRRAMSGKKKQYSVRLPSDTADKLEQYCEERDLSYADALRRFAEKELLREQMEREIAQTDGGLTRDENPWINPVERVGWIFHAFALAGVIAQVSVILAAVWAGSPGVSSQVFVPLFAFTIISEAVGFVVIGVLEYVTHPYDAPLRQYFRHPEVAV